MKIHPWQAIFMETVQQHQAGHALQKAARNGGISKIILAHLA